MSGENSIKNQLEKLTSLVTSAYLNLEKISEIVKKIEQEEKKSEYKQMPGVEGVFDGTSMVTSDGKKFEVPANYAAKSRLVYGDALKMIEENGKSLFKQLDKPERKELKAVASKKEGKWYAITDTGSYRLSDVAAEHNKLELNDEIIILLPVNNLQAPFATLDTVITQKGMILPPVSAKPVEIKKPVEVAKPSEMALPAEKKEFVMDLAPTAPVAPKAPARSERSVQRPSAPRPSRAPRAPRGDRPMPVTPAVAPQPSQQDQTPSAPRKKIVIEDDDLR